jgi:hypothetical protein
MNANLQPRPNYCGMAGSLLGLLALIAAVLPQWALPQIFPPQSYERIIIDNGHPLRNAVITKLTGVRFHQQEQKPEIDRWSDALMLTAVSLALLAITLAVVAVLLQEVKLYAGVAAALGASVIAYQVLALIISVALGIFVLFLLITAATASMNC